MKPLVPWNERIDPATIPDDVLASERGKRNAAKRQNVSGGGVWAKHRADAAKGCRCARCNRLREAARAAEGAA